MKRSPTDDRTVIPDRYEVQSTEELQSISQAFDIGKKEQLAFWTNPMIDSTETKPTNRVTLSIWFWRDPIVLYYCYSAYLYKRWTIHFIPISILPNPWKTVWNSMTLCSFWFLDALRTNSMSFRLLLLWFDLWFWVQKRYRSKC